MAPDCDGDSDGKRGYDEDGSAGSDGEMDESDEELSEHDEDEGDDDGYGEDNEAEARMDLDELEQVC